MDDTAYFCVQSWMVNKLNLKGAERDTYAIIYGFCQDGESDFHGSLGYIAELTGYSRNSICAALKSLTEKNLIVKSERVANNIKFVRYTSNLHTVQATCTPIQATCTNNKADSNKKISNKVLSKDNTTNFSFGNKPKKENLYSKCLALIDGKTSDPKIRRLLVDWLNMLLEKYKDRGLVLYANVLKGKLNMLDKFDTKDWVEIIEYNLQKGYEGFYPIKSYSTDDKFTEHGVISEAYTEEELKELAALEVEREKNGLRTKF